MRDERHDGGALGERMAASNAIDACFPPRLDVPQVRAEETAAGAAESSQATQTPDCEECRLAGRRCRQCARLSELARTAAARGER